MNKHELILAVQQEAGLTRTQARSVVETFFEKVSEALAAGERVELRGLCSFHLKEYAAYIGRNPKTGEKTPVEPKKLPFFKPGLQLKDRVNAR